MYSAYKLNKQGDNIQPWRTPLPIWNQSVVPCPVLTVASWPAYRFLKRPTYMWILKILKLIIKQTNKKLAYCYKLNICVPPISAGSWKKQESSRETSISALLTMPKPLTVWIPKNCGKFFKRWEYQTTWPASWETYMQVRKQQLELDMEQHTGSK